MLSFGFEAKKNTIDIPTVYLFVISLTCSCKKINNISSSYKPIVFNKL